MDVGMIPCMSSLGDRGWGVVSRVSFPPRGPYLSIRASVYAHHPVLGQRAHDSCPSPEGDAAPKNYPSVLGATYGQHRGRSLLGCCHLERGTRGCPPTAAWIR